MRFQWKMASPVGVLHLAASDRGLCGLWFREPNGPWLASLDGEGAALSHLRTAVRQLEEYFDGRRTEFDLPLDVEGTAFQRRVWAELANIPYGTTVSYRDVAARIGQSKAVRAVGAANGRNPVSIVVPCHRVVQADGSLGGYGGGLPTKRRLLSLETRLVW